MVSIRKQACESRWLDLAERVAGLAALGITEVAYQPMGDVPRELPAFAAATMAGAKASA